MEMAASAVVAYFYHIWYSIWSNDNGDRGRHELPTWLNGIIYRPPSLNGLWTKRETSVLAYKDNVWPKMKFLGSNPRITGHKMTDSYLAIISCFLCSSCLFCKWMEKLCKWNLQRIPVNQKYPDYFKFFPSPWLCAVFFFFCTNTTMQLFKSVLHGGYFGLVWGCMSVWRRHFLSPL